MKNCLKKKSIKKPDISFKKQFDILFVYKTKPKTHGLLWFI